MAPPRSPFAFAASRWRAWWQARLPRQDAVALTHRNVYILPTRAGFMLAATLLVLLIASINYQLSLGYLLTFLLAGSALASMHACHATLRGLTLHLLPPEPQFCATPVRLRVVLHNPGRRPRRGLGLRRAEASEVAWCEVPAQGSSTVELGFVPARRGWQAVPVLSLETRFPLGAFRAWAPWHPATRVLVYPRPEHNAPPLPPAAAGAIDQAAPRPSSDAPAWDSPRPYRRGDALKQVVWKKAARTGELVSRDGAQGAPAQLWLDLADGGARPLEQRLSRLCAWVLEAEQRGLDYGLRLGATEIAPGQGAAHAQRCLEALALA